MARITFYPLGNADTTLIELDNNRKLLIDYAHTKSGEDEDDKKIDLANELKKLLNPNEPIFDVVAFTHADTDHTRGAADFFEFDHAQIYKGKGRVKIKELWVPAAMILEEGLAGDDRAIRQEARYRLRIGQGVRVFSSPSLLDDWFQKEKINKAKMSEFLTDAGMIAPGFSKHSDGLEIFVHSPFAHRDGDTLQSRNNGSMFLHLTFFMRGEETKVILGADTPHEILEEIVKITRFHKREDKLSWDIFKLPHHCSYKSLNSDKGLTKTQPKESIDWLFSQTRPGSHIISTSLPILENDDSDLPPHRQAANYYKEKAKENVGYFKVTMEHPNVLSPKPMVFEIGPYGPTLKKEIGGGSLNIISSKSPRMG